MLGLDLQAPPNDAGCGDPSKMVDEVASGGVPWSVHAFGSSENQNWTTEVESRRRRVRTEGI